MPVAPPSETIGYVDRIPIPSSFDRVTEAHFWIHGLENFYHDGSRFRWNLNAFLKALKEIPGLLQMEMQNKPGFTKWFAARVRDLQKDPLIEFLSGQRDKAVHQKMIVPHSKCSLGVTEGRGMKLGFGWKLDAREDSDHAMHQYLYAVAEQGDFLGILEPDDDSIPCVYREWRLHGFDEQVIDLTASAWLRTGETVAEVLEWAGFDPPSLDLDCRHGDQKLKFKLFDREELQRQLSEAKVRF